ARQWLWVEWRNPLTRAEGKHDRRTRGTPADSKQASGMDPSVQSYNPAIPQWGDHSTMQNGRLYANGDEQRAEDSGCQVSGASFKFQIEIHSPHMGQFGKSETACAGGQERKSTKHSLTDSQSWIETHRYHHHYAHRKYYSTV